MMSRVLILCVITLLIYGALAKGAKETEKKSTPPPTPPKEEPQPTMFVDFDKLEVVDLLRSGALIVGFVAAFFSDKKGESANFQLAHSIFLGLYGLAAFFCPSLVLGYQTVGTLDKIHIALTQCVGCYFIGLAVVFHRQYHAKSRDAQVSAAWLLATTLGGILLLEVQIHSHLMGSQSKQRFSDQHITFTMLGNGLVFLGALFKLWENFSNGNGSRISTRGRVGSSELNSHMIITLLLAFPQVILPLAAPEFYLDLMGQKPDTVLVHLTRTLGTFGLVMCILFLLSLQFEYDSDRRDILMGVLVMLTIGVPLSVLLQYKQNIFPQRMFYCNTGFQFVFLMNTLCACYCRGRKNK